MSGVEKILIDSSVGRLILISLKLSYRGTFSNTINIVDIRNCYYND